jgi:hypothetical protein
MYSNYNLKEIATICYYYHIFLCFVNMIRFIFIILRFTCN